MSEETTSIKVDYASNSHKDKQEAEAPKEERKVNKIVEGTVVTRKKPFFKRVSDTLTGDDAQSIVSYVIFDVVIPAGKDMIFDAVKEGFQRALYGDSPGRSSSRSYGGGSPLTNRGYVAYNRANSTAYVPEEPRVSASARRTHNFRDVFFASAGEAELVCDELVDMIQKYQEASVSDFYSLVGADTNFTDTQHGWVDIHQIGRPRKTREGWLIDFGKTVELRG